MSRSRSYIAHETGPESAMTEVALALAMGIFSIMVLAMISMGISPAESIPKTAEQDPQSIEALVVSGSKSQQDGTASLEQTDLIVVFHQGRFFNDRLKAISARSVSEKARAKNSRVILAIDSRASLEQVLEARRHFPTDNLIITRLDQAWIDRLSSEVKP